MRSFWDSSWNQIDPDRIAEYGDAMDMGEDEIISALHDHGAHFVCDAGCGCGIYARKLAKHGFTVGGFDISARAVAIAQTVSGNTALKTASILATGYGDGVFDAALARDVIDHLSKEEAVAAVKELCRITRPDGIVLFTLDSTDEEYEAEPHIVSEDGSYVYTGGKWEGMVFHPYRRSEVCDIVPSRAICEISEHQGSMTIVLKFQG